MRHTSFIKALAGLLFTATLCAQDTPPNIIFILADDLGYGDLGCYGQKQMLTPHIDRLASEGMRFTQCYAGSTVCAPTRSVLMTGLHTGHTTVRGNFGWGGPPGKRERVSVSIQDEDITVAEVLKQAGYTTGVAGKWGLGESGTEGIPNKQGFDEWLGFLNQRHAHGYYPEFVWQNEKMLELKGNLGGRQKDWIHDRLTDFAFDFIGKNSNNPFFLYLAYTIPHGRYEVPNDRPYTDKPWHQDIKNYAAMVTRMDSDVGKIIALLKQRGIDKNTIVFFASDNGAEIHYFRKLKAEREYEATLKSPGPLRGWKRDLTDGGIRVPMIVRWPGKVPAGKVSDFPWAFWDFLPTAADLAGASLSSSHATDGFSVLPTLLGQKKQKPHEFFYWEFHERGFQQAVRHGDYKAIRSKQGEPLVLYDITQDIQELNDIAKQHPDVIARIETFLKTARSPSPSFPK
jgi:arylsulfatase A-like enzyme